MPDCESCGKEDVSYVTKEGRYLCCEDYVFYARSMIEGEDSLNRIDQLILAFNEYHGLDAKHQSLVLVTEIGELIDAILKQNKEDISDEAGDVLFCVWSVLLLKGIAPGPPLASVAKENIFKDPNREGEKVSKSGLE
jgi:NTP pyrophosphatase (non-canonical NTP hydrolase)